MSVSSFSATSGGDVVNKTRPPMASSSVVRVTSTKSNRANVATAANGKIPSPPPMPKKKKMKGKSTSSSAFTASDQRKGYGIPLKEQKGGNVLSSSSSGVTRNNNNNKTLEGEDNGTHFTAPSERVIPASILTAASSSNGASHHSCSECRRSCTSSCPCSKAIGKLAKLERDINMEKKAQKKTHEELEVATREIDILRALVLERLGTTPSLSASSASTNVVAKQRQDATTGSSSTITQTTTNRSSTTASSAAMTSSPAGTTSSLSSSTTGRKGGQWRSSIYNSGSVEHPSSSSLVERQKATSGRLPHLTVGGSSKSSTSSSSVISTVLSSSSLYAPSSSSAHRSSSRQKADSRKRTAI